MADAEPRSKTISFPAIWDGVHVIGTAVAHSDQIDLYPVPGLRLEVPLEVWRTMAPFLTAAAMALPVDPPTGWKVTDASGRPDTHGQERAPGNPT